MRPSLFYKLFSLLPAMVWNQTLELGENTKLHYQGHIGLFQQAFPLAGGKDPSHFATQSLMEIDLTLSLAPKYPVEFRLHPRINYDVKRDYDGSWGPQTPPVWLDDVYIDWFTKHFELRAGYQIFSWKTVESVSQADILNQGDREADLLDPPKIGEPSIRARFILPTQNQNVLELYYLPVFTPSPLPASGNRYDLFQDTPYSLTQDEHRFVYLSDEKEYRTQWAARYQTQLLESFDFALYYFHGYRRFPLFKPIPDANGKLDLSGPASFTHVYPPLFQSGFTFQGALGSWLWKGESALVKYEQDIMNQKGQAVDPFLAYTLGFEYTFFSPFFQDQDLGTLLEVIGDTDAGKDEKELEGFRPFRSHLFAGTRYTFNNTGDRSILAGFFLDYIKMDQIYRFEYSERLLNHFSLKTEISAIVANGQSQFQPFEKAARFAVDLKYNF